MHVIADALYARGIWESGGTAVSVANNGVHIAPGASDASLWLSTKPGSATTTTVSSSGWAGSPSPAPRVINGVAIPVHGSISGPDTPAPTAPTDLTAGTVSSGQVNLSWTASTDNVGVTGYFVERCQGVGCSDFSQIASPGIAAAYSDTTLTAATSYSYRVRAVDAAGDLSAYSNVATLTTPAVDTQPPTTPGTLTAVAASGTEWISHGEPRPTMWALSAIASIAARVPAVLPSPSSEPPLPVRPSTTLGSSSTPVTAIWCAPRMRREILAPIPIRPPPLPFRPIRSWSRPTPSTKAPAPAVTDLSGNGNTGTIVAATSTASGKYGSALSFNGTTAQINIPDAAAMHLTTAMTLEAWVDPPW